MPRYSPRAPRPTLIVENIGLDPLDPTFSFFQKLKALPLLIGQQYKVHLKITNQSGYPPRDVRISLGMWIKEHGHHKLKREVLPEPPEIPTNQFCYDVYSKPYLMRDTGSSDLKIQAYANGQRLTLQYKNRPTQILVYAYHVEPWRSSVLAILISAAGFIVALVVLALRWIRWL